MSSVVRLAVISSLAFATGICPAQTPSLAGTWKLNVEKSRWGARPKPVSVVVNIEHSEPSVKYSGRVVDAREELREFSFSGTIDGKEYPATMSGGEGKVVLRRVNRRTISAELTSNDGKSIQGITTTVSPDGRVLTRRLRLRSPDSAASWTEIYEKQ